MIGLKLNPKRKVDFKVGSKGKVEFKLKEIMVPPGRKVSLKKDYDPDFTGGYKDRQGAVEQLALNVEWLAELQEKLYAQDTYGLLVIFQARDAAGKDGAIKHVLSGVNPQGCHVTSFKAPSAEELDHDYLWRTARALPARGMIGIFNRSYYEEVLVVRVHPDLLEKQKLPGRTGGDDFWKRRFEEMNNFEKYLVDNGIVILKFFLNVSKEEQRRRLLARIDEPEKNWKFSLADCGERALWNDYQEAYEEMLSHTSKSWAPWFVIPADHKWFARLAISQTICAALEALDLKFPETTEQRRRELLEIRKELVREAKD
jgi:PPK2 family polyphosphate:nucleotide phosphotransferase